jgi:hypothetical protein
MSSLGHFAEIRAATGFVIPPAFVKLERQASSALERTPEHWRDNWRRICMTRPPALPCAPWYPSLAGILRER